MPALNLYVHQDDARRRAAARIDMLRAKGVGLAPQANVCTHK
jgi:hypothetical protein